MKMNGSNRMLNFGQPIISRGSEKKISDKMIRRGNIGSRFMRGLKPSPAIEKSRRRRSSLLITKEQMRNNGIRKINTPRLEKEYIDIFTKILTVSRKGEYLIQCWAASPSVTKAPDCVTMKLAYCTKNMKLGMNVAKTFSSLL
jgi:hypothetical protein